MQTLKHLMFFIAGGAVFSLLLAVQVHNAEQNTAPMPKVVMNWAAKGVR